MSSRVSPRWPRWCHLDLNHEAEVRLRLEETDLSRSRERTRPACCPRRPAEGHSESSGGTPEPTRGTRALPGPLEDNLRGACTLPQHAMILILDIVARLLVWLILAPLLPG